MRVRRDNQQITLTLSSQTTLWELLPEPARKEAIKMLSLLINQNLLTAKQSPLGAKKGASHDGQNHGRPSVS